MSYRSFKRVLGETSLERKCRFLFGACLLLLITGSFWWYGQQTGDLVYKQNRNMGPLLVNTAMMIKHQEIGIMITDQETGEEKNNEEWGEFISKLNRDLQAQQYSWDVIWPRGLRPVDGDTSGLPRDEFEKELLSRWDRDVEPEIPDDFSVPYAERDLAGARAYQYYQPVFAAQRCVSCHRSFDGVDLTDGGLIRIMRITIPNDEVRGDLEWNKAILASTAFATVFLAMVVAYVIVRYVIVKPLQHLRDVSDAISHGEMQQRANIHTGDEFEELGTAFNRMLGHLLSAQDELKEVNSSLDSKVDELAQANMRLFEMNRLKSDFLATMSHELRTPLNSIIGFSDVLAGVDSMDDRQRRYVSHIQSSGRMLLEMINDLLDLAKIESGKMDIRLSEFQLDQLVGEQCDLARPLSERKNIDLSIRIEPNLPTMRQDRGKIQQILNNLLSNAIKFTPEGGRIRVEAHSAGGLAELVVVDTGVGIAEEDQTSIFEKFRQGNTVLPGGDAMTREYSGTGLGLSIVKELCRLLGGTVTLTSELGKGSTFTTHLPWQLEDEPKLESALAASADELTRPRRADVARLTTEPVIATGEAETP